MSDKISGKMSEDKEDSKEAQYYLGEKDTRKLAKKHNRTPKRKKSVKVRRHIKKDKQPVLPYIIAAAVIIIVMAVLMFQDRIFPSYPELPSDIVAVVNGEPIFKDKINEQYNLYPEIMGQQITKELILNKTIEEVLLLQEAKKQGITASEEEVDSLINSLIIQSGISQLDLDKQLRENGMTMEDLKVIYAQQIKITKLLNMTVLGKTEVSDEDTREYYDENIASYSEDSVAARHILLNSSEEAQEILLKLEEGEDFAELAEQYSSCPSAADGGYLGEFTRGMMVPEFEEAAFSLDIGEISGIVETEFGYHIILVTDKKTGTTSFSEAEPAIRSMLLQQKQQDAMAGYIKGLKDASEISVYLQNLGEDLPEGVTTFKNAGDPGSICTEDGKPIVRVYTTTTCPHCNWAAPIVEKVFKEYSGQIVAHHWIVDTGDDSMTEEVEESLPDQEMMVLTMNNPAGFVPFFYFGCRYSRTGTGFEAALDGENKEALEYSAVIESLLDQPELFVEEEPIAIPQFT